MAALVATAVLILAAMLVLAAEAAAAYSPRLLVNSGDPVAIRFTQPAASDPTARIALYVPLGFGLPLDQPVGATVATAAATAVSSDLGGPPLKLTGTVVVANGIDPTLPATSQACTAVPTHSVYWLLTLSGSGQTFTVPLFVDPAVTPSAAFAAATVVGCLPAPDVPVGTPGRAPAGAKITDLTLSLTGVTPPSPPGVYRWRAVAAPYTPGTGQRSPTASVEIQSLVGLPPALGLTAQLVKPVGALYAGVRFSGHATAGGEPVTNAGVRVYKGGARVAFVLTDDGGRFHGTLRQRLGAAPSVLPLTARLSFVGADLGSSACRASFSGPPPNGPFPCIAATRGPLTATQAGIAVRLPARRSGGRGPS